VCSAHLKDPQSDPVALGIKNAPYWEQRAAGVPIKDDSSDEPVKVAG
jgi:hypothetical protein